MIFKSRGLDWSPDDLINVKLKDFCSSWEHTLEEARKATCFVNSGNICIGLQCAVPGSEPFSDADLGGLMRPRQSLQPPYLPEEGSTSETLLVCTTGLLDQSPRGSAV